MSLVKSMDFQVSSLLDGNGQLRQFTNGWPPSALKAGDPTYGVRLWSVGETLDLPVWQDPASNPAGTHAEWNRVESVWTPPSMPNGLTKAARYNPSPVQPHTQGQRPRSQLHLSRTALPDAAAIEADPSLAIPPSPNITGAGEILTAQPVTGFFRTRRTFRSYFCIDPGFDIVLPNWEPRVTTLLYAWHNMSVGEVLLAAQPQQVNLRRTPESNSSIHLTVTMAAGRHQKPIPPWPYDDYTIDAANGQVEYMEFKREFYLDDPNGPGIEFGTWHELVVDMYHHYEIGQGWTDFYIDGVKMVGAGGLNAEIPGRTLPRGPSDPGRPDLGDYSGIPNLYYDEHLPTGVAGPQTHRFATYCYSANEGYDPKKPGIYHWQVWNKAIWHTGMGFYTTIEDVPPAAPRLIAPMPSETFTIYGAPEFRRLTGDSVEEDVSILPTPLDIHPRFRDRVGDEWRPATART